MRKLQPGDPNYESEQWFIANALDFMQRHEVESQRKVIIAVPNLHGDDPNDDLAGWHHCRCGEPIPPDVTWCGECFPVADGR